jgi:hypothetical protein
VAAWIRETINRVENSDTEGYKPDYNSYIWTDPRPNGRASSVNLRRNADLLQQN